MQVYFHTTFVRVKIKHVVFVFFCLKTYTKIVILASDFVHEGKQGSNKQTQYTIPLPL